MSYTDFEEGTLPATPEEEQSLQQSGFQKCRNQLCNYHISPDVTDAAYESGNGSYTCPHCGLDQDVLKTPGQPGGGTNSGLKMEQQAQIGEDLVHKMGAIPGYGPIIWWHGGGTAGWSVADGAVPGWLVEVKTVNWNTQRRRGIINTRDRQTKLRAIQNPDIWRSQMGDPALDKAFHQLGNVKGLLGILVLLDFEKGTADIFARPMPHDPNHPHGGIINFSQTGATQIAQDVPFESGLPDPRQPGFVSHTARTALDYGGDAFPGQEPQAVEDQNGANWDFNGHPPNLVGDETKNDPAEYTEQHNFFYGNGQLHVSPDHDHEELAQQARISPDHVGPMASGKVTVINGKATWEVLTNVALAPFFKILKDYTKHVGWRWGGMTDLEGQPISDDFAPKKSFALGPDHPDYDPYYDEMAEGWRELPYLYHTAPSVLRDTIQREGLKVQPVGEPQEPGVYVEGNPEMAKDYWGKRKDITNRDMWKIDQHYIESLLPDYMGQAAYIPHDVPPEALSLHHFGSWHLAEYPGGGNMNDMMVKHYQNDGEDLETNNQGDIHKNQGEDEWFPEGSEDAYRCKECGNKFGNYRELSNHIIDMHPLTPYWPKEDGKAPEIGNMDAVIPPRFQEYPQFYESSWNLAGKDPKDTFSSPIPFIYDIDQDNVSTGFPGQKHSDIVGQFTPGGIVEGTYEPGGKVVLRTATDRPYTIYHLVDLWYHQHPHLEVTGVHSMDQQGKTQKLASDPIQKVKQHVAMDPAVDNAYRALETAGGRVHVVGGAVRDAIRGEDPKDIDLMVTGLPGDATRRALEALPGRVDLTGKDFGVFRYRFKGHEVEIALPRRERSTGVAHQDFEVQADPTMSPEEDLSRRDFTANAMAIPLSEHRLIDPYGGANDIRSGTLRVIGDHSFSDDPLRVVRALTANARHGLDPDGNTRLQMMQNAGGLQFLPQERVQMELQKIMSAPNPAKAIELAHETGVLRHILPEVDQTFGYDQNNAHHAHDLGTHLLQVLDNASKITNDPDVRLAALLHDIGKPASAWVGEDGFNHYFQGPNGQGANHEQVGARMAEDRLKGLKFPGSTVARVGRLIEGHMFPDFSSLKGARRFLNRYGDGDANDLLTLREADRGGKGTPVLQDQKTPVDTQRALVQQVQEGNEPTNMAQLAINGNDLIQLGYQPGPLLGQKLQELTNMVVDDPSLNSRETLLQLASK